MSDRATVVAATLAALTQTVISVATFFVVKVALEQFPWMALTTLRAVGSGVLLALILATRSVDGMPRGADLARTMALGVLGVTVNQACYIAGMAQSTPARASLLYALTPLVVLLIGVGRGIEPLSLRRLAGIVLAFAGVSLVLSDRGALEATPRGDAILLVGVLAWASYSALGKRLLQTYDTMSVTAIALLTGTVAWLPFGLPELAAADLAGVTSRAWAALGFMVVFTSVIAYAAWFYAIRRLAPSRVAVFMNLQPPMTFAIAWAWFGEPLTGGFLAGSALALLGVALAQYRAQVATARSA